MYLSRSATMKFSAEKRPISHFFLRVKINKNFFIPPLFVTLHNFVLARALRMFFQHPLPENKHSNP